MPLPKAVLIPTGSTIGVQGDENKAVALDKGNREEIINLLNRRDANEHDFYTFPNLFGDKDKDLKVKNIDGLTNEDEIPSWYIYPTFTH